jgi:alkyl hydroperoxide reductase subunit AhpC
MKAPFPMIGDHDHAIGKLFGARWPLVNRYRRVTFVLDEAGSCRAVIEHEIIASRHRDEVLEQLKSMQRARGPRR